LAQGETDDIAIDQMVTAERGNALHCIKNLPPAPAPKKVIGAPPFTKVPPAVIAPLNAPIEAKTYEPLTNETLRGVAKRLNLALPLPDARIVIHKKRRLLELFNGQALVKSYHVALGNNPGGHKQTRGDGRTPEGQLYICTRNAKDSAFHIFLGLSYPALPDATRAANQKIISWRDYQIIRQRLASRGAPLWQTRLGGWVGIHGGSDGTFAARKKRERRSPDWTAGCVALTNAEIAELHAATKMGTPVLILP
jgi:hypothetical protein